MTTVLPDNLGVHPTIAPLVEQALALVGTKSIEAGCASPESRRGVARLVDGSHDLWLAADSGLLLARVTFRSPDNASVEVSVTPWHEVSGLAVNVVATVEQATGETTYRVQVKTSTPRGLAFTEEGTRNELEMAPEFARALVGHTGSVLK